MMAKGKSFKKGNRKTFGARDDSNAQGKWSELIKENGKMGNVLQEIGSVPRE